MRDDTLIMECGWAKFGNSCWVNTDCVFNVQPCDDGTSIRSWSGDVIFVPVAADEVIQALALAIKARETSGWYRPRPYPNPR